MNQLLCDELWSTIARLAKRAATKRAAVAYVSSDALVKFRAGDVLVTDASDQAIATGQTSARVLAHAHKAGAELFSLASLHAKVLLLDGTAVTGSANLSGSSANSLVEAAWVTDNPAAVGMATALVEQLVAQAEAIDARFLKRASQIKVERNGNRTARGARRRRVKVTKPTTWLVSVRELGDAYPDEEEAVERGERIAKQKLTKKSSDACWLRFTGNSKFRKLAKVGDTVIQIWFPAKAKRPLGVYRHTPIVHRQNERRCTRFFVEEFADEDKTSLSWASFKKLAKEARLPESIGPGSVRSITPAQSDALFALWPT